MVNNKDGYFQHYPFAGGYLEQPAMTMRVLRIVQGVYHDYLREVNKVPGV
jgi:hypothetical protein